MAEAPMFNDEAEFRREFETEQTPDEIEEFGLAEYLPGEDHFDNFVVENYNRIPEDAWATPFSQETGNGAVRDDPRVWLIFRQAHLMGFPTRQYYADYYYEQLDRDETLDYLTRLPPPSQAEIDDAFHQRQMDYIATLPVEPLDPINRYNSQTPEYVTAYDLGVTPSPQGEPPEYLPPLPVYTTPEYSPSNQPCRLNMCVNDAMPGSEFCSSCHGAKGRRRITRRSRKPHSRKPRRSRKPRSRTSRRSRKPHRSRRKGKSHKKKTRSKK